jgi:hypothetical protein
MLVLLALVAFLAAAIWFAITRAWPMLLLAAGLTLWLLSTTSIHISQ